MKAFDTEESDMVTQMALIGAVNGLQLLTAEPNGCLRFKVALDKVRYFVV